MMMRCFGYFMLITGLLGIVVFDTTLSGNIFSCVLFMTGSLLVALSEIAALLGRVLATHLPEPPRGSDKTHGTIEPNETLAG